MYPLQQNRFFSGCAYKTPMDKGHSFAHLSYEVVVLSTWNFSTGVLLCSHDILYR